MEVLERLADLGSRAEILGEKRGKTIVRVYTKEKGWIYAKISDDQALDAFAAKVKAPAASQRPKRVDGK